MNKSFFVLLIVPSNWYVRFMPQTTKVCHQKLKCQQEQRQGDREELGRGTQCPLLLPAAAGVLGPLSLLLSLDCQFRSELAASFEATGSSSLRFLVISRDLFSRKPQSFQHCFGIYMKAKLSTNTLNDSIRGSWEASLYVSLFGRLSGYALLTLSASLALV